MENKKLLEPNKRRKAAASDDQDEDALKVAHARIAVLEQRLEDRGEAGRKSTAALVDAKRDLEALHRMTKEQERVSNEYMAASHAAAQKLEASLRQMQGAFIALKGVMENNRESEKVAEDGPILMIFWGNDEVCNEFIVATQKEADAKADGEGMTVRELLTAVDGKGDGDDQGGDSTDAVHKFHRWFKTNQAKGLTKQALRVKMPQRPSAVLEFSVSA